MFCLWVWDARDWTWALIHAKCTTLRTPDWVWSWKLSMCNRGGKKDMPASQWRIPPLTSAHLIGSAVLTCLRTSSQNTGIMPLKPPTWSAALITAALPSYPALPYGLPCCCCHRSLPFFSASAMRLLLREG